jgi:HK97 family phage major capsid protein
MTTTLTSKRQDAFDAAVKRMHDAADAIEAAGDDADLDALQASLDDAAADVERTRAALDQAVALDRARQQHPLPTVDAAKPAVDRSSGSVQVTSEPGPYSPVSEHSFFRDMLTAREGDAAARDRLIRSQRERLDKDTQLRDMTSGSTSGAEFYPPLYLAQLVVEPNIAGRPFADAVPKLPLPDAGVDITVPQLASGVAVANRSDGGSVQETDGVTASITSKVNEIAGQVDLGRINVMRSFPGLDTIIMRTLVRRYNVQLDTQLLAGTGTAPQHRGIRAVSGINTVTYTDATPTAAELLPKVYDAIQKIAANRLETMADAIVMHPRRAAWLASNLSSTFPLFQQGSFSQGVGGQDGGFIQTVAGLRVIVDPNIATNYGAGTNEDEIYVVSLQDLILMEGPLYTRVFEEVGSGTGVIRYQVFGHSAFLGNRYPTAITAISGTGLVTPTF